MRTCWGEGTFKKRKEKKPGGQQQSIAFKLIIDRHFNINFILYSCISHRLFFSVSKNKWCA